MKRVYSGFAIGLLYGFGLGVLLDKSSLVNVTSLSLLIGFLALVPALGWLETYTHRRRLENWPSIQRQGKFMFVLTRYVVLRGGIIAVVLMYALRDTIGSVPIHGITVPVLLFAVGIIGVQEWTNCEKASELPMALRGEERDD